MAARSELIMHVAEKPDLCVNGDGSFTVRLRAARGYLHRVDLVWACKYRVSQPGAVTETPMALIATTQDLDVFQVTVVPTDPRTAYVFRVTDRDGLAQYDSPAGLTPQDTLPSFQDSAYQLGYAFPSQRSIVPTLAKLPGVVYQIFPDRFDDSDPAKPSLAARFAKQRPDQLLGGNLDGITARLDYLKGLGVAAIYLTPVFKSSSYHRYDVEDYEHVDARLGGDQALLRLTARAHELGLKVVLDDVFNHTSAKHLFFRDVIAKGPDSPYWDFYLCRGTPDPRKGNYERFAFENYMPKINTANPKAIAYFTKTCVAVTKRFGIDGWRFDVADEIAHAFWQAMHTALRAVDPGILLIGEDWMPAEDFVDHEQLDGVMNYPLRKIVVDLLASPHPIAAATAAERINTHLLRYAWPNDLSMLNLLSSHDVPRFYTLTGENPDKTLLGLAIMAALPGMLMVYYGDELRMAGGPDPDNRRPVDWDRDHWDQDYLRAYAQVLAFRRLPAVIDGRPTITATGPLLAIRRQNAGQAVVLTANAGDRPVPVAAGGRIIAARGLAGGILQPYGYVLRQTD